MLRQKTLTAPRNARKKAHEALRGQLLVYVRVSTGLKMGTHPLQCAMHRLGSESHDPVPPSETKLLSTFPEPILESSHFWIRPDGSAKLAWCVGEALIHITNCCEQRFGTSAKLDARKMAATHPLERHRKRSSSLAPNSVSDKADIGD